MTRHNRKNHRVSKKHRKSRARPRITPLCPAESLEDRRMFCVDWTFSGGTLSGITPPHLVNVTGETIALDADGSGNVIDQGSLLRDCNNTPLTVPASQVQKIYIKTRAKADTIDLSAVDATTFPSISSQIVIDGDAGHDKIKGSQFSDYITGNLGNDEILWQRRQRPH